MKKLLQNNRNNRTDLTDTENLKAIWLPLVDVLCNFDRVSPGLVGHTFQPTLQYQVCQTPWQNP